MNQRNSKPFHANVLHGLSLSGTVVDRTRRMIPRDNPTTEIVTYTIQDDHDRKFYVDDYAPDDYAPDGYHDLRSNVCLPVYIKVYIRKNGEPSYALNIQKADVSRSEHF